MLIRGGQQAQMKNCIGQRFTEQAKTYGFWSGTEAE